MDVPAGDHGEVVRFPVLRSDLREDLREGDARGHGDAELLFDRSPHLLCDRFVRTVVGPPEACQVHEGLVDGVFLNVRGEAPQDLEHAHGKEAVGLVIRRQDDRVGAKLLHVREPHATRYAAGLGLVRGSGHDAALLAGDDRTALQLRVDGLLAGSEEGVGVEMHDGLGPGGEGNELVVHVRFTA